MSKVKMIAVTLTVSRGGSIGGTRGDEIEVSRLDAARMHRAGQIKALDPKLVVELAAELADAEAAPVTEVRAAAEKAAADNAAAEKAAADNAAAEKAAADNAAAEKTAAEKAAK